MSKHRQSVRVWLLLCSAVLIVTSAALTSSSATAFAQQSDAMPDMAKVVRNYGKLPLRFEANHGQTDSDVKFLSRGAGYQLYFTRQGAVLALNRPVIADEQTRQTVRTDVIRMQLSGGNPMAAPSGVDALPGTSNYLLGNDSSSWHTNVPNYARVRYDGVYPGVDLVYYGNQQQLEYDFIVAAGTNPNQIRLRFEGATALRVKGTGDLVIQADDGEIAFRQPMVYQMIAGHRKHVSGRFTLLGDNSVGFVIGRHDKSQPLVIDPTLVYSTYLGGSNSDTLSAIAVDSSGAAYLTGYTTSSDYPVTPGVFQTTVATAFVTKLNASGSALVYSTFLGGTASSSPANSGNSIAVDASGNAYVTGSTYAANFPVTSGAFQTTNKAATGHGSTAFLTKINPSGTALVYSTYLGGTRSDGGQSLVLDPAGDVYLAGYAYSNDFPTTAGVVQAANNSYPSYGWNDFVSKVNPTGASLLYSTLIGGSSNYGSPAGIRLAVDASGDAFVTATVLSKDFPVTSGAYQLTNKSTGRGNMTLAKLNPTATKLLFATYLGTTSSSYGDDVANGLAVDGTGNAYLAGSTHEADYPVTTGAYQTTNKTGGVSKSTGFITKMNSTGTALVYSTYLGGSSQTLGDYIYALALDSSGDVYLTGSTGSTDFPVTSNAYQETNLASSSNGSVVFLTELNPAGSGLLYSTYFGGANSFADTGYGIALGSGGAVYITGTTGALNFPITTGSYETTFNSQNFTTGFVSEFTLGTAPTTIATTTNLNASANPVPTGTRVTYTAYVTPNKGTVIPTGSVVFTIDQKAVATVALSATGYAAYTTSTALALGQHAILASYSGSATYSTSGAGLTESIVPTSPVISPSTGVYSMAQFVTLTDATPNVSIYYTTDGTLPTSGSTKYTSPILVSASSFIRAVAVVAGAPNSAVPSASYKIVAGPSALAVSPTSLTASGATVNGLVNPFGLVGSYYFQYGTVSTALTRTTAKTPLPGGVLGARLSFTPIPVAAALTGLAGKTTYYYRVVITTSAGTSSGQILSFTTN